MIYYGTFSYTREGLLCLEDGAFYTMPEDAELLKNALDGPRMLV
jgi:hypothetical protein